MKLTNRSNAPSRRGSCQEQSTAARYCARQRVQIDFLHPARLLVAGDLFRAEDVLQVPSGDKGNRRDVDVDVEVVVVGALQQDFSQRPVPAADLQHRPDLLRGSQLLQEGQPPQVIQQRHAVPFPVEIVPLRRASVVAFADGQQARRLVRLRGDQRPVIGPRRGDAREGRLQDLLERPEALRPERQHFHQPRLEPALRRVLRYVSLLSHGARAERRHAVAPQPFDDDLRGVHPEGGRPVQPVRLFHVAEHLLQPGQVGVATVRRQGARSLPGDHYFTRCLTNSFLMRKGPQPRPSF